MKHEIYETENTVVYCSVFEDADLEAMTDDELCEELDAWRLTAAHSDDDDYDVIDNVRLIEKHIARRAAAAEVGIPKQEEGGDTDEQPRYVVLDILNPEERPGDAVCAAFDSRDEAEAAATDMARMFEDER